MTDIELLVATIIAYKNYIDAPADIDEEKRSELLMAARTLDLEVDARNLYQSF